MFENSDDYDFTPSGSSKLASLFGGSMLTEQSESNNSLTYTAPKQPKLKKDVEINDSTKSKIQTSVVLAKIINLWKLVDNDYKHLGRHGFAIIGSTDLNVFEVISYKEKNNIILRKKIDKNFTIYNQKDCFSSFYDNENQNWLVKFDNGEDQSTFYKEITHRGAKVLDNTNPLPSPRKSVSQPTPIEASTPLTSPKSESVVDSSKFPDTEDQNSDSSGSQKRANILSRMAKMGQQILPKDILKNTNTDLSDSELDDSFSDHKIPPRKFKRAIPLEKQIVKAEMSDRPPSYANNQVVSNANYPVQYSQPNMAVPFTPTTVNPIHPGTINPLMVSQPYDGLQQFIISQNVELKMNLAQISAKLDSVMNVTGKSDTRTDDSSLKSKIKTLELRSENLLTELSRYESRYEDLQKKCKELEGKCRKSVDESVIDNLNKQIENMRKDLQSADETSSYCNRLESELSECKSTIQNREKIIEEQKSKLKDLEEFYEKRKDSEENKTTVNTLNDTITGLSSKLSEYEERFRNIELEKQKRIENNQKTLDTFSENIKIHMNNMYQSILGGFEPNASYSVSQINSQVAQNLKGTTFAIIKEFKDIYSKSEDS